MIKEAHVSYEVGILLKEKGFNEWCRLFYTTAIRHNGKDLSFDEELDLKDEGRENEIERTPGGWINEHNNRNQEEWLGSECCSCPSHSLVVRWLREKHHIFCLMDIDQREDMTVVFYPDVYWKREETNRVLRVVEMPRCPADGFESYDDATEYAIKYSLENLVKHE